MFNIKPRLQRWVEWDVPILNKQVKMLYDAFPSSLLANLATAGLMSLVQWSAINHRHLMAWWVSLVVVLLMRIGLYAEYKHSYFNLKKIVLLHAFRLSVLRVTSAGFSYLTSDVVGGIMDIVSRIASGRSRL